MFGFVFRQLKRMAVQRMQFGLLLAVVVLQAVYQLLSPILYKFIFDEGITQGRRDILYTALGVLAGALVLQAVATVCQEKLVARISMGLMRALRRRLFAKLQSLPPNLVSSRPQGELTGLFGSDLSSVELALVRAVPTALLCCLVIATSLVLLLVINWVLFLVTLAALPVVVLLPKLFSKPAREWETRHQTVKSDMAGFAQESIATLPVVRLFHLESAREQRHSGYLENLASAGERAHLFGGLVGRTAFIGTGFSQLVVIGVGAILAVHGFMTAGLLVAFVGLLLRISDGVYGLTTVLPMLMPAAQADERIEAFLREPVPELEAPEATAVPRLSGAITLEDVGFSYDNVTPALKNLSLTIEPGQRVAFIGPSGCGKSTVLSLLMRFNVAQSGAVHLGDRDITRITESSLRENVSVVPQTAILFEGTILENILAGRAGAGREDAIRAAQAAGIHEAIVAKPEGYETWVKTSGGALSGGERQRIAVARALLRQAPVLLLDEATSALDPASEHIVNETVSGLAGQCTIVSVTHRLASVVEYDRIFVLKAGELVESGTHAQLLEQHGLYATLWGKQQGMNLEADTGAPVVTPERLALVPLLSGCRPETLRELSGLFTLMHFAEGQTVFQQGEPGELFYLVARGQMQVLLEESGAKHLVATLHDGDFFGEQALVRDQPRAASVVAWSESWCLALPRQHFLRVMQKEESIQTRITAATNAIEASNSTAPWRQQRS